MSTKEFESLLLNNVDFLKPFAFTLTRDNESAKDLTQETLYRALANKDKYNVGTNVKEWMYTIMRNIFINSYRRKSRQQTIFDNTPNDFLLDHNQSAVSNQAESKMKLKEIQSNIGKIPINTAFSIEFAQNKETLTRTYLIKQLLCLGLTNLTYFCLQ